MFRVGLTGGIASGKTAVSTSFAKLGVPVIDTDQIARDIVEPGTSALQKIVKCFGPEVLDASGHLDRRRMRERVFADPAQRRMLEAITHPAIREELARRSAAAGGPYQVLVIPLLVEGGSRTVDRVLVVDCPEDVQLARLMERDRMSETQAKRILGAQATRQQRLSAADDVLSNTGSLVDLEQRVEQLHEKYLQLAGAHRNSES